MSLNQNNQLKQDNLNKHINHYKPNKCFNLNNLVEMLQSDSKSSDPVINSNSDSDTDTKSNSNSDSDTDTDTDTDTSSNSSNKTSVSEKIKKYDLTIFSNDSNLNHPLH